MKQFILKEEPDNNIVRLDGNDYHYLVRVRRLAVGEFFPALLPDGKETLVQILSVDNGFLTGKCGEKVTDTNLKVTVTNLPQIILFQALPGGDKMDLVVRQAAEGGIAGIVPFVSEYSLIKPKPSQKTNIAGGQKFNRWQRIIKEARQQSGSKIATTIQPPMSMEEMFNYWEELKKDGALGLLFHHQGVAKESLHGYLNIYPNIVVLAIGPEGGFSGSEVSVFLKNGFKPLTIGDTVLRTETAALYCAAATRIILLERDSWELKQTKR